VGSAQRDARTTAKSDELHRITGNRDSVRRPARTPTPYGPPAPVEAGGDGRLPGSAATIVPVRVNRGNNDAQSKPGATSTLARRMSDNGTLTASESYQSSGTAPSAVCA
jgi:hypothetical protein